MKAGFEMLIGLVYDLRSDYQNLGFSPEDIAEFDSQETVDAIDDAIKSLGHRTVRIGNIFSLCQRLTKGEKWDLVFNIAEGLRYRSREAQVPALLEAYDIPYTFSDALTCAITLDKALTKTIVRAAGIATPDFALVRDKEDIAAVDLKYPLFAKPFAEGTGKGIDRSSRIINPKQLDAVCRKLLERFGQPVLVEEFLPGREFTTAVLGSGEGAAVLGTMEIVMRTPGDGNIYSYDAKERCEDLIDYIRFDSEPLSGRISALALGAYRVLQCRDAARIDIRCDALGKPSFLEVNPLPGLHPSHSDLPMIAAREGLSFSGLIARIIDGAAMRRH